MSISGVSAYGMSRDDLHGRARRRLVVVLQPELLERHRGGRAA
jgi:hypothetical protein